MPITRPRHLITETDQVAHALDDAAERWPEDRESRATLLLRLVEEGHQAMLEEAARRRAARLAAIQQTSGVVNGTYGDDYLKDLREDWPAGSSWTPASSSLTSKPPAHTERPSPPRSPAS